MAVYKITDEILDREHYTDDLRETLGALFTDDNDEILEAIDALATKATRGEYTGAEEAFLAIKVESA